MKIQYSYKCVESILAIAREKAYQEREALSDIINTRLQDYIAGRLVVAPERKRDSVKAGKSSGRLDFAVVRDAKRKAKKNGDSLNSVIEAILEGYNSEVVKKMQTA